MSEVKQYRLYEDNTLVITEGGIVPHLGFLDGDGNGHQCQKRIKFDSASSAEAFIDRVNGLRWCDDFDQHETMNFRTWYRD